MLKHLVLVLGFLLTVTAHADCGSISAFDQNILNQIFTLRDAAKLGALQNDSKLNAIAKRVADANLERSETLEHRDAQGKALTERAEEEGYAGHAGEIVSVGFLPCENESETGSGSLERSKELGIEFKEAIRNSPAHYQGIMARTGTNWDQFGYSVVSKRIYIGRACMQKYSLGLVLGKQP
jgi:uncharacterized protein YkwD